MITHLLAQAHAAQHQPRVHGNGFIQLDLSDTARLHIWGHPDIPQQKTNTPIHDHMFAFSSLILRGAMTNAEYDIQWDGKEAFGDPKDLRDLRYELTPSRFPTTHTIYKAEVRDRQDTILKPTDYAVHLRAKSITTYTAGQSYTMEVGQIHESVVTGPTATIILKRGRTLAQGSASPSIFVPVGLEPDNGFHRYALPAERLWQIIHEVIG